MKTSSRSGILLGIIAIFFFSNTSFAQQSSPPRILPMQERAEVQNRWLEYRLDNVVPKLIRRNNIDMWIIDGREYNEDPVIKTMLPATWQTARRRTILIFWDNGEMVKRLAVARYDIGKFFKTAWDKSKQPDQWQRLADIIEERDPQKIALNYSSTFALADGISHSEYEALTHALPEKYQNRIVSGENLAIGWLETRTEPEMQVYPMICHIAHDIIEEGFSEKVIQPGITTTKDVEWWYRERIRDLNLTAWFHPSVSVQRATDPDTSFLANFSKRPAKNTIRPGDLLHVDFGITYLGLNTDTQQHAYVLKPGESTAPKGLQKALSEGNKLQDILTSNFKNGRTGNEVLALSRTQAKEQGITPSIYTHPIGFHGHGAGPTIGLWDQQGGVAGKGDYPLYPNTAYSIELNATVDIPEWGKSIRIMLEEDAFFNGDSVRYIDGRQTKLMLIPRQQ
ncbi:M24 family metallopeptidase [Fodinibius halophilus]|uniref:Aminopeptidase P family protein n=1 Tax=Fodinibius halophilus TaxID=1736908 RepID=A0A6M1T2S8_9BACT|nr:M24 family metallopeptidase [Fodinibius halophilus]NGP89766.1 aminopeptidase P family protein [Fodinibius halophilus]